MNITVVIVFLITMILSVGALFYLVRYMRINRWNARGKGAEKTTKRTLKRYALTRNFKVLTDVVIRHDDQLIDVEAVLVGFFGVLLVQTCGARGEYYGKIEDENWVFVLDDKKDLDIREPMKNPLFLQRKAIQGLRQEFANRRIYNVDIDQAVVIGNSSRKTAVFVTQEDLLFTRKEFKAYLKRVKFDKDLGINVEDVSRAIEEHSQRNLTEKI